MRTSFDSAGPALSSSRSGQAVDRSAPLDCLLCGGTQHRSVFMEFGIDILRCKNCGHVFSSFPADPHYSDFWGDDVAPGEHHYWCEARARMHREFFERFVEGRAGRLLDMGCGLGFFLKAMAPYRDWEAHGCEISPAAIRYAREQLGLKHVICTPLQDADLPRASFDIVTMWDVLDHIPHPDPLLSHCHTLLKDDGVLFIRTPNIAVQLLRARLMKAVSGIHPGRKYLQGTDHPHHYSVRSIKRLLERNGFPDVAFIHLHPVESEAGWKAAVVNPIKNASFQVLRALAVFSGGYLNYDNLFVVARKRAAAA